MATMRRLYRSGNSIVLGLPAYMLDMMDLSEHDRVVIEYRKDNVIILRKADDQPNTGIGSLHSVKLDPSDPLAN